MAATRKEPRILITSALPYVNNEPHLGNIVGSVLSADVFSRFCKARRQESLYVCGTDEYGTTTETRALQENCTPQELVDRYNAIHKSVYDWFEIEFDIWGRTSTEKQTEIAQGIFKQLDANGFLEEKTTIQPYCETHHSFLADRFVEGECPLCGYEDARGDQCDKCGKLLDPLELLKPRCKIDGATPVPKPTSHIFILLDKLQPRIEKWFESSSKTGAWASNGIAITKDWLQRGLQSRGITRDLKWGVPVPKVGFENKVMYVWFEACIGYVSITAKRDDWREWWFDPENTRLYQFMGKDNTPFHSVIFPATQLGTGDKWTMLHHLSTTEYLNYEGGKFSKSRNIGVFGTNAKDTGIPPDIWRYYLLSRRPESGDTEFEWSAFIDANNNDLLKNLGNFVNRIIKFVIANYDSTIPDFTKASSDLDWLVPDVNEFYNQYIEELQAVKLRAGLATALRISSIGNLFLQKEGLGKELFEGDRAKCDAVVGYALQVVHLLAGLFYPYLPATSKAIYKQLNLTDLPLLPRDGFKISTTYIVPGAKIGEAALLFTRIEGKKEEEWKAKYGSPAAEKEAKAKALKTAAREARKAKKASGKADLGSEISSKVAEKVASDSVKQNEPASAGGVVTGEGVAGLTLSEKRTS